MRDKETGEAAIMLITDEGLFGPVAYQVDIFEAIADVEAELAEARPVPVPVSVVEPAAPDYGAELGVIDLFGAGQLALEVA
jgi:hypothetical protein